MEWERKGKEEAMNEDVSCSCCPDSADLPFVVSLLTDFVSVKRSIFDFS